MTEYSITFEFACECGRHHKLKVGREGIQKIATEVDRRFYGSMSAAPTRPLDAKGPTIQPTLPDPDTIRNA